MVSYNEPSNHIRRKCLIIGLEASVKCTQHQCAQNKMELIYIQFGMKGQGSLELALEI